MLKYTYKCNECGHVHTTLHSMSKKLSDCLECGCCDSLQRVVTIEDTKEQISELQQEMINGTTKN